MTLRQAARAQTAQWRKNGGAACMRVLMISDVYFPRINGVSTSIQTFCQDLIDLGHEVTLIAPDYGQPGAVESTVLRIPGRKVPRDPEDRLMRRRAIRNLVPELARNPPDIVHVHTPFVAHYAGLDIARALDVPVVTTYHTYFEHYFRHYVPFVPHRLLAVLARRLTAAQCAAVDLVISPSTAMLDALRAYGVIAPIEVVPTGLDPACFVPGDGDRFRTTHRIAPDRHILLHVGRAAHEKNIDFLLRMFVDLKRTRPSALLVIAGEGPALPHLQQLARRLGHADDVRFVGYLERGEELPDCYAAADIFVFASRTETQGLVLLEAMAQGTPVVSNAEMGTRDVLAPDRGARIVALNEARFAAAAAELLSNHHLRSEMSHAAREHALGWSSRKMAERLGGHYQELVMARRRAGGRAAFPRILSGGVRS
jgi:glycosyltransferase involved in cell wall biosynthesis